MSRAPVPRPEGRLPTYDLVITALGYEFARRNSALFQPAPPPRPEIREPK